MSVSTSTIVNAINEVAAGIGGPHRPPLAFDRFVPFRHADEDNEPTPDEVADALEGLRGLPA